MNDSLWTRNYSMLNAKDPGMALQVSSVVVDASRVVVGQAANRAPIVGVAMGQGGPVALNHTQKPMEDAQQWVDSLDSRFLQGGNLVLIGVGTGYHALALHQAMDRFTQLWIVEPDPMLFRAAMNCLDFSPLFQASNIRWIVGKSAGETAADFMTGKEGFRTRAQGVNVAFPPFARVLHGAFIQSLQEAIQLEIQKEGLRFRTWEEHSRTTFRNIAKHIPRMLRGAPLFRLQSIASGVPGLVIAPGPSLEEAIPFLKNVRDHAVLIAVDTAHRILLRHGIHAHLVVSVDFTELNVRHFDDVDDPYTALVAFPGIDPAISEKYPNRTFFFDFSSSMDNMDSSNNLLFAFPSLQQYGRLLSQGSTAHAAYHVARFLGCAPIVLLGNDLGFPGERFYASGAMQETLDLSERKAEKRIQVPANDGSQIPTNGLYLTYLGGFVELIRSTGGAVWNASLHGATIDGVPYYPLETIRQVCASSRFDQTEITRALVPADAQTALRTLAESDRCIEQCEVAYKAMRRMRKTAETLRPASADFHPNYLALLKEIQELTRTARNAMLLAFHLAPRAHHNLFSKMDDAAPGTSPEKNQISHERLLEFLDEIRGAVKDLREWICEARDVIREDYPSI